jgi:hypothetical protein
VITRKPGDYISHASKFTTSLFYHVASSVNRVTDLFVHQERRGTSHQTRFYRPTHPATMLLRHRIIVTLTVIIIIIIITHHRHRSYFGRGYTGSVGAYIIQISRPQPPP